VVKLSLTLIISYLTALVSVASATENSKVIAASGTTRVSLIELYSSESCSSCPPADQWISGLEANKALWTKFVPVVFHVDYWNHLSWKDDFSSRKMTDRQIAVSKTWSNPSVYTPAITIDGREWRGWRASKIESQLSKQTPAIGLKILKNAEGQFSVQVTGQSSKAQYLVNIALLGIGLNTKVTDGENSGKNLAHSFVVLDWQSQSLNSMGETTPITLVMNKKNAKKYAVVAWIEESKRPVALQATGGYL
jgi:hypothetical protein